MNMFSLVRLNPGKLCLAALLLASLSHPLHAQEPSAAYLFETSDTGVDSTGNGNSLPYDSPSTQSTTTSAFGEGSLAIPYNNGSAAYGLAGVSAPLYSASLSQFTLTFDVLPAYGTINTGSGSAALTVFRRGGATADSFFTVTLTTNGAALTLRLTSYDDQGTSTSSSALSTSLGSLSTTSFTNFALTYDEGTVAFYEDGDLLNITSLVSGSGSTTHVQDVIPAVTGTSTTAREVLIGSSPVATGTNYLDDVGFFGNQTLSSSDISQIATSGLASYLAVPETPRTPLFILGGALLGAWFIFGRRRAEGFVPVTKR